ncbi:MAG TPA: prolipoprotein diacylglyceryl transferase [Streptosporangiaceae bacterium]|nr:prolipoprotein diacylglyceryl transferase [Streptosporangiaceae bacterium]
MTPVQHPLAYIPSPPVNGFHIGPLFVHFYGLMYVIGITLAVIIMQRRVRSAGGDASVVGDIAVWAVPAGIIGGRIYFDITTPAQIPHVWYGVFAVWSGGLGIWGGIAAGALVGVWRVKRRGLPVAPFADAVAPALLVAQAVGRIGNYFNQELYGRHTTMPWGLKISGHPGLYHPTFLYELIFDLALAALLVWLGHHTKIKPPGLFALYVTGYSAFRIYEESLRIDYSQHFLGLRLNTFVASALTALGIIWFLYSQRRKPAPAPEPPSEDDQPADEAGEADNPEAGGGERAGEDSAGSVPGKTGRAGLFPRQTPRRHRSMIGDDQLPVPPQT